MNTPIWIDYSKCATVYGMPFIPDIAMLPFERNGWDCKICYAIINGVFRCHPSCVPHLHLISDEIAALI